MTELQTYPDVEGVLLTDAAGVAQAAEVIAEQTEAFALDTETTGLNPKKERIRLIQITLADSNTVAIDAFAVGEQGLAPLFEVLSAEAGPPIVMHNAVFDLSHLWMAGCIIPAERIRCTMLQERCLTAGITEARVRGQREDDDLEDLAELVDGGATVGHRDVSVSLEASVKRRLNLALPKDEQKSNWATPDLRQAQLAYAYRDPHATLALYNGQLPVLADLGLEATAELENQCAWTMAWMGLNGLPVDRQEVTELRKHLLEEEGRLRVELLETLDAELIARGHVGLDRDIFGKIDEAYVKPNHSPTFLDWMRKVGIDLPDLSKSTRRLSSYIQHPVMAAFEAWKGSFSLSLYGTKLAGAIEADDRVYCNFRQYGAGTGRMTSSQPINLQNIPRDARFRKAFKAPQGFKAVVGDYPTVEPRISAELSKDKVMLEIFRAGRDIYKGTAAALNSIDYDDVTPAQRKTAKPILLGLQYGMGAANLGRNSFLGYGVTLENPEETRDAFFSTYSGLRRWHRRIADKVDGATTYECRTPLGRRRVLMGDSVTFTTAVNTPVQGCAADIMKRALVLLPQMILEAGLAQTELVSVVHDEVILIAADAEAETAAKVLAAAMEAGAAEFLEIPLKVDVGIGDSWGTAKV
jgi:DNA polymerase I-like protein with 3'-5' exonuclease and polymerase domains